MDKRIPVKFENISLNNKDKDPKSQSNDMKSKKVSVIKPTSNQVINKSPATNKVFKDKQGNILQPFAHHFEGINPQNGDIKKSVISINDLINDYSNLEK